VVGGIGTDSGAGRLRIRRWTDLNTDLCDLCLRLVKGLKDEELPALLARDSMFVSLLPEQLALREATERGDGGLEWGRLLAAVFDKVTAGNEENIRLRQARDLLGLSRSDPGFQERLQRLKATGSRDPRQPDKLPNPLNIETRLGLAAQLADSSERNVRREAGAILRALLTAVNEFRHDDGAIQALAAEFRARRRAPAQDDPLDAPEIRRVLRLCAQFALELDQAFDAVGGPASFSTGLYVIRGVQKDLLGRLVDPTKSAKALAIVGEAGYGKTSLLWGLLGDLTGRPAFHPPAGQRPLAAHPQARPRGDSVGRGPRPHRHSSGTARRHACRPARHDGSASA
jgi:hypothetical protein